MISPEVMFNSLKRHGIDMFAGVPDSLLSNFCAYVDDHGQRGEHIITANEGNAVALAAGYHMSTGKIGAVYMQNSGLGNTINPLTSLTDPEVYKIPLLMIIGWRGEPGVKDEPQHVKQGRITIAQLKLLEIPYWVLDQNSNVEQVLKEVFLKLKDTNAPVALLVRKDAFDKYKSKRKVIQISSFEREEALRQLLALVKGDDLIISTTGKTSREVFELRMERRESQRDFLTVGGMGHTASIALGVALGNPKKRVICLDGDGSVLMHMGALPIIGDLKPANMIHVLLNNSAHESVGGQMTVAGQVNFAAIAKACGYLDYQVAKDADSLMACWAKICNQSGPVLLEVKISVGSRGDLGRPTSTPEENKRAFMEVVYE
ncbi:phosphonopyruvate decarboxylase [Candidatus Peregrinibacteria bacterium]|jgi:phosphonopyruvate decarboxylase|nr:phosphonopyruvate decarboxylase [Candidatus Peregrinibacteria bacterium]